MTVKAKKISKKRIILIVAMVVLMIGILSAVGCMNRQAQESTDDTQATQGDSSATEQVQDNATQDAQDTLSDDDRAQVASYGAQVKALQALLEANLWQVGGGAVSLTFADDTFTVTDGARQSQDTQAYVIEALEDIDDKGGDDGGAMTTLACIKVPDQGYAFMKVSKSKADPAQIQLSSSLIQQGAAFNRTKAAKSVDVEGVSDQAFSLIHSDQTTLAGQISEYCAVYYPAASSATFAGTLTVDTNQGVVSAGFTLDGGSNVIYAVYYDQSGSLDIQGSADAKS